MLLTSSDTKGTLMHLFLFTNSAQRELQFQYVRREYETAINFPCITPLSTDRTKEVIIGQEITDFKGLIL